MKSLKEISNVLNLRDKIVKGGLYSRYDLESIEEVVPASIADNDLVMSDIPTYPNEVERERIVNKMYGMVEDIEILVNNHYLDNLNKVKGLLFNLLDIKAVLERVSMLLPDPIDRIDDIHLKLDYCYQRLLDNDVDLVKDITYNDNYEYKLVESNDPDISKSLMSLSIRLGKVPYQGDMKEYKPEWNGFIIKHLLGVSNINYSVISSLLNNPKPMIEKIDEMVLTILTKTSEARDLVTDFSNRKDNDLKELVDLDFMASIDSAIRGTMEDKASFALIKLFAFMKFKTLK